MNDIRGDLEDGFSALWQGRMRAFEYFLTAVIKYPFPSPIEQSGRTAEDRLEFKNHAAMRDTMFVTK